MKRWLLIGLCTLALLATAIGLWLWWHQPVPTEMSLYVPAETLVYIETKNLPELVTRLTATDAWKALAPAANLEGRFEQVRWLSRIPFYTGLGGSTAVVFARAQIGIAVLGFETSETQEGFKVKPQIAMVIATHAGDRRALEVSENLIGEFARQNLGAAQFTRVEREGATLRRWSSADDVRTLYSTTEGEFVVVGNDESAVAACLQTIRGQRPNLSGSEQLKLMREKMAGAEASAFGYVSPQGLARLIESLARAYIERATDQRAQGLAASLLPQLANRILGPDGAGWSARFERGGVEDHYSISLRPGMADLLRDAAKVPAADETGAVAALLPRDTYQMTTYLYAEPAAAWLNFNNALTAQLDTLSAVIVKELLKESLQPYGIASPLDFLRAVGPGPAVARIDTAGASTVTIINPEDLTVLRQLVTKHLGSRARAVRVGDAELLVSSNSERGAASFVDNFLLIGPEEALRRCLTARASKETLIVADNFRQAQQFVGAQESSDSVTYTNDRESALDFIAALISSSSARAEFRARHVAGPDATGDQFERIPYAVTLTRFSDYGVERRTRSSFGQFGTIASQLTTEQR